MTRTIYPGHGKVVPEDEDMDKVDQSVGEEWIAAARALYVALCQIAAPKDLSSLIPLVRGCKALIKCLLNFYLSRTDCRYCHGSQGLDSKPLMLCAVTLRPLAARSGLV